MHEKAFSAYFAQPLSAVAALPAGYAELSCDQYFLLPLFGASTSRVSGSPGPQLAGRNPALPFCVYQRERNSMKNPILLRAALAAAMVVAVGGARAELTLVDSETFQSAGLGAVNTVLTIQSPGNSSVETGGVQWNGTADLVTGDAMGAAVQTSTRSFASLGIDTAANLRVVFNPREPGNANSGISLNNLTLNVFDSAGAQVFSAATASTHTFADTSGNASYGFALSPDQTAQLQAVFSPSLRVGLTATASDATGGFETFYVTAAAPVPEPAAAAMLAAGLGLGGLVALSRRRRPAIR